MDIDKRIKYWYYRNFTKVIRMKYFTGLYKTGDFYIDDLGNKFLYVGRGYLKEVDA